MLISEVHAINEHCAYLTQMVHKLGLEMKTTAMCTQVRRIRYGHFTLMHALLRKHWDAQSIIDNIRYCRRQVMPQLEQHTSNLEVLPPGELTPLLDSGS